MSSTSSVKVRTVPQLHAVGHHIGGFARMDHGHRHHAGLDGLDVAADDGLERHDELSRHGHGVDHHMRHGRMTALAAHHDLEFVAGGHGRPCAHGHGAGLHARPVVHAENGLHGELLEQSFLTISRAPPPPSSAGWKMA